MVIKIKFESTISGLYPGIDVPECDVCDSKARNLSVKVSVAFYSSLSCFKLCSLLSE